MRYCPKCGYEYRPEIETCPDCGAAVVDRVEQPPAAAAALSVRAVVWLAVVACLAPWLWCGLMACTGWVFRVFGVRSVGDQVAIAIPLMLFAALLIASAAAIYGYTRRTMVPARLLPFA